MKLMARRARPAREGTSRAQIVSNAVYSFGSYALFLPAGLWVTRFTVDRICLASFGIWSALTTVIAFQGLLDLGIATPLIKYVSEYAALGRGHDVNALLSTAMVAYAAVSAVFALGLLLLGNWVLVHLLHGSSGDSALRILYLIVVVGFAVSLTFSVLSSLLLGLQRADLAARLALGYNLAGVVGTVLVLSMGLGLRGLAYNWAANIALTIIGNFLAGLRLFRDLRLNPFLFRWSILKKILSFSTKVQVTTLALFLNQQVDRFLIALALGRTSVGYYQLTTRVTSGVMGLSYAMVSGTLSAASEFAATNRVEKLRELFLRSTRYHAMVTFPLCGGTAVLAAPFVRFWLGPHDSIVAWTLVIIVIGYAVWLVNAVTVASLNGIGRPDIRMRVDVVSVIVHVPIAAFLLWRFGYFGTVTGSSLVLISSRLYLYRAGARELHTKLRVLITYCVLQPGAATLIAALAVVGIRIFAPLASPIFFLIEAVTFGLVYLAYLLTIGMDTYDRSLLRGFGVAALAAVRPIEPTRRPEAQT